MDDCMHVACITCRTNGKHDYHERLPAKLAKAYILGGTSCPLLAEQESRDDRSLDGNWKDLHKKTPLRAFLMLESCWWATYLHGTLGTQSQKKEDQKHITYRRLDDDERTPTHSAFFDFLETEPVVGVGKASRTAREQGDPRQGAARGRIQGF